MNIDLLDNVRGYDNEIVFVTENGVLNGELTDEEFELLDDSFDLRINGSKNTIQVKVKDRKDVYRFLKKEGLYLSITGDNNKIELGSINYCENTVLNIRGLQILIGGTADGFLTFEKPRYANNCTVRIGDGTQILGAKIHLQDDNSEVNIGKDCIFAWGIDVWCSDVHSILDMEGNRINLGRAIEISDHVWVGKDVKIGKNTKISKNSIVGWGSVVTKQFNEENVIIAGNPANIIKTGVNWQSRDSQTPELVQTV